MIVADECPSARCTVTTSQPERSTRWRKNAADHANGARCRPPPERSATSAPPSPHWAGRATSRLPGNSHGSGSDTWPIPADMFRQDRHQTVRDEDRALGTVLGTSQIVHQAVICPLHLTLDVDLLAHEVDIGDLQRRGPPPRRRPANAHTAMNAAYQGSMSSVARIAAPISGRWEWSSPLTPCGSSAASRRP